MPDRQLGFRLLANLLMRGPATTTQLMQRIGCSQSAIQKAYRRMGQEGFVMLTGRGARAPGKRAVGSTPYVIDVGPLVRAWAVKNVKPPRDDDE